MKYLALLIAFACQKPLPELDEAPNPPDAAKLIDAGKAIVQSGDPTAPILLNGSWWWRPHKQELRIWTLCQGDMDARGCVLFVGNERGEVLEHVRVGWTPPKLRKEGGGLVIEGEDGRSSFERTLRYEGMRLVIGPDQRPEGS